MSARPPLDVVYVTAMIDEPVVARLPADVRVDSGEPLCEIAGHQFVGTWGDGRTRVCVTLAAGHPLETAVRLLGRLQAATAKRRSFAQQPTDLRLYARWIGRRERAKSAELAAATAVCADPVARAIIGSNYDACMCAG